MRLDYRPEKADRVVFGAFLLVIIAAPVPFGSNREWSALWLSAGLQFLFALWLLLQIQRSSRRPRLFTSARVPLTAFALWNLYVAVQLIPLPNGLVAFLNPGTAAFFAELPGGVVTPYVSLTLDRGETASSLLQQFGYFCAFILTMAVVSTRRRARIVLTVLLGVGMAEALYGVVVYLAELQGTVSYTVYGASAVTGTYLNRNHFAGLMELTIPAAIGLMLIFGAEKHRTVGNVGWLNRAIDFFLKRSAYASFAAVTMVSGLLLSTSRGGLAACGLSLILVLGLGLFGGQGQHQLGRVLCGGLVVLCLAVAWLGLGNLTEKLQSGGFESNRADIRSSTYAMISDFAVFGSGAGTFQWVFPSYKTEELGLGFYEHAHNDYLELLAEQGIIGFLLGVVTIATALAKQASVYTRSRDPTVRGTLFATLMGTTALLIHGTVDFNLQIPANAVYFFVLLGLGCAVSTRSFSVGDDVDRHQ